MPIIEERVDRVEIAIENLARTVEIGFNRVQNSQIQTEAELREFKEEMREFKDEMREFKNEMREDTRAFKDEMKEESKKKNKEWSNLAKKMGTLVEDLIAPALRPVLSKYFNCEAKTEGQRMFKRKDGEDYEIDAIAVSDDKVFMIEVKSTPTVKFVDDIAEKSGRFFEFYPEYRDKRLVIILGSITFPDNVIKYASGKGMYVMGWREWEYMDILNFNEVVL